MRIFLFLFIIFLCINFNVCGQTVSQVKMSQNLFREAQNHLENNETELFKKKVIRAADLRPKHPSLMLNCAYAFCLMNEFDSAIQKLNEIAQMGIYIDISNIKEFDQLAGRERDGYKKISDAFKDNLLQIGRADIELQLPDSDLLIEGVAFDKQSHSFFLSSIHKQKVIRYDMDEKKFSESEQSYSPFGMRADPENGCLWISMAGVDQGYQTSKNEVGRTGIAKLDLETLMLVDEFVLPVDSVAHQFGDLLYDEHKFIYLSDSKGGSIYRVNTQFNEIKSVSNKEELISPQGLAFAVNQTDLIVADYSLGLVTLNPETGKVNPIENQTNTTMLGIDGLYRYRDELIAVQNGIRPNRILKLTLNEDESAIIQYKTLAANHPAIDDPTLGVVSGDTFYFNANSQWKKFTPDYNSKTMGERVNPIILSVSLE